MNRTIVAIPMLLAATSCGFLPERVKYEDPRLKPMWEAVAVVDREAMGFTPIEKDAEIRVEGASKTYDVMLHIYGTTSRTIEFRKSGDKYKWIGEQEIHTGPRQYEIEDGTDYETITITYETERTSGFLTNQINVTYLGPDTNLTLPKVLQLDDVREMIKKWDKKKR